MSVNGGGVNVKKRLALANMADIVITGTPADNEVLAYDLGIGKWINQTALEANLGELSLENTWTANQTFNDSVRLILGTGADSNIRDDGSNLIIESDRSDGDIIFRYNDGGTERDLYIDASARTLINEGGFQPYIGDETYTANPGTAFQLKGTKTLDYASAAYPVVFDFNRTIIFNQNGAPIISGLPTLWREVTQNDTGSTRTVQSMSQILMQNQYLVDGGSFTISSGNELSIQPVFGRVGGSGTFSTSLWNAIAVAGRVNTGATVTAYNMLALNAPTITGTVTTLTGINIAELTGGGTNRAIFMGGANAIVFRDSNNYIRSEAVFQGMHYYTGSGRLHRFYVASTQEVSIAANIMEFNNGAADTQINWATSGQLGLQVSSTDIIRISASQVTIEQDILFSAGAEDYLITTYGGSDSLMGFQSREAGSSGQWGFFTRDGDGTDDIAMNIFGVGVPGGANVERLRWLYLTSDTKYHIRIDASGSGTLRNLILETNTDAQIQLASSAALGFFGATPVTQPLAYTQTYSTADKTHSAYTADDESSAYTGIDNAQGGTPYAQLTDLNALRTAYENLRASHEDTKQIVNSIIDDLQSLGLVA